MVSGIQNTSRFMYSYKKREKLKECGKCALQTCAPRVEPYSTSESDGDFSCRAIVSTFFRCVATLSRNSGLLV